PRRAQELQHRGRPAAQHIPRENGLATVDDACNLVRWAPAGPGGAGLVARQPQATRNIGPPPSRPSDEIDGPVPSVRECLLDPLDSVNPLEVSQPLPCCANRVNGPIPGRRQPITEVTDHLRNGRGMLVEPIPGIACPLQRPTPRITQPTS